MIRDLDEGEIRALHFELLLKDIIATAERLPPFPDVAWKVAALIRKSAPAKEIEAVIRSDPRISAGVLTLGQSGHYGRNARLGSVEDAVVLLESGKLVEIILSASASRYFEGEGGEQEMKHTGVWKHSVAAGVAAEITARKLKDRKALTVFTASLLHDIGKTVLDLYKKIYIDSRICEAARENAPLIDLESTALGINHQELGEHICRRWRFPPEVVSAVGNHHCPEKAASDPHIAAMVHAANVMARAAEKNRDTESVTLEPARDPFFIRLGISEKMTAEIMEELELAMDDIHLFLVSC